MMKEEVLARDFDLGFSGNSEDVVMHAIQLLGNCVTITHTSRKDEFFITPSTTVPSVFELNFYSNGVLHVFIMEAIIGTLGPETFSEVCLEHMGCLVGLVAGTLFEGMHHCGLVSSENIAHQVTLHSAAVVTVEVS